MFFDNVKHTNMHLAGIPYFYNINLSLHVLNNAKPHVFTYFLNNLGIIKFFNLLFILSVHIYSYNESILHTENFMDFVIGDTTSTNYTDDNKYMKFMMLFMWLTISLFSYAFIETTAKECINNSILSSYDKVLHVNINKYTEVENDKMTFDIIQHADNINKITTDLFIELPHKIITIWQYGNTLSKISFQILLITLVISIISLIIKSYGFYRTQNNNNKLTANKTQMNLLNKDTSNSIQYLKSNLLIDVRINDFKELINHSMIFYKDIISWTSLNDFVSNIAYLIAIIFMYEYGTSKNINPNLMVKNIRASGKLIDKITSISEYTSNVYKQYKSFEFFNNIVIMEKENDSEAVTIRNMFKSPCPKTCNIVIKTTKEIIELDEHKDKLIRLVGENGSGKSTMFLEFLNLNFALSSSNAKLNYTTCDNIKNRNITTIILQKDILSHIKVEEFVKRMCGLENFDSNIINKYLATIDLNEHYIEKIMCFYKKHKNKQMNELSGGQNKMIVIISSILKFIIKKNKIIMFDESEKGLDKENKEIYIKLVEAVHNSKNRHITFVITHDETIINNIDIPIAEIHI